MQRCQLLATFVVASVLLTISPAVSQAFSIAGFGNSITCDTCNDGSYLGLLDDYLIPAPVIFDHGDPADVTDEVLFRLDLWLDSNSADVVILLTGTPDTYQAVGGFNNKPYVESDTVDNVEMMLDLVLGESMSVLLVAPPPVQSPCGNPTVVTCATIDARLASLASEYAALASSKSVPFVDLYDIFSNDPDFSELVGSANSLYRNDGLHPKLATGDDLIAASIASTLLNEVIPEPSTGLLLAAGLAGLAVRRKSLLRGRQLS